MTTRTAETWRDVALDAMGAEVAEISLHDAQPDGTGSNEVSGDGYQRELIGWNAAEGATLSSSEPVVFTAPGDTTVRYVGFWGDGGQWLGALRLSTPESFGAPGAYELTQADLVLYNQQNGNGS